MAYQNQPGPRVSELSAALAAITFGLLGVLATQASPDTKIWVSLAVAAFMFLLAAIWEIIAELDIDASTTLGEFGMRILTPRGVVLAALIVLVFAAIFLVGEFYQ